VAGLSATIATTSAQASPPALQPCTAAQLKVVINTIDTPVAVHQNFVITNRGESTCGVEGYPTMSFFTASTQDTRVIPVHTSSYFAEPRIKLIPLAPAAVASFGLGYRTSQPAGRDLATNCDVSTLAFAIPPGSDNADEFAIADAFDACRAGNRVALTPLEAGSAPQLRSVK